MSDQLLLVDDEPALRSAVQAYLEESGFTVQTATNGNEGWEMVQRFTPDLVISDVMMPQADGYQFLKKLRDDVRFQALPVIFLTARGMTGDRITGYDAGCDAYISKPFDPDELVAIIKSILTRQRAAQAGSGDVENPDVAELARQIKEIKALLTQKNVFQPSGPPSTSTSLPANKAS